MTADSCEATTVADAPLVQEQYIESTVQGRSKTQSQFGRGERRTRRSELEERPHWGVALCQRETGDGQEDSSYLLVESEKRRPG